MRKTQLRLTVLLWSVAVLAVLWAGVGDRVLTHISYAVEKGRIQASSQELAQLQDELPRMYAVSRAFKLVAKVARPGVVHIKVWGGRQAEDDEQARERLRERLKGTVPEDQLEHYLRRLPIPPGSGSGIVIDADGHILTNSHVVAGRDEISVVLFDERAYKATLVGTDPKTDLAVLKIDAADLHPLALGDSDALEVGDWVIAVGAPFGLTQTVTHGIVSAKGRTQIEDIDLTYQEFVQTDAAINPGNSGGPLLNLRGEVVGINTAIATHGTSYNAGIAFAIPSNLAAKVAEQLKTRGEVPRGWLGVGPEALTPADVEIFGLRDTNGVLVGGVLMDSPAERAGVQVEDVILSMNDVPVTSLAQFRTAVADLRPFETSHLRIVRDREEIRVRVRLELQPESVRVPVGRITDTRTVPRLGMKVRTLRPDTLPMYDNAVRGVVVLGLQRNAEDQPEIALGELIVGCDGQVVKVVGDLNEALKAAAAAGKPVRLEIMEPVGDRRIISILPTKGP